MTRLTEALERAHLEPPAEPQGSESPAKTGEEVLRTWHFDVGADEPPSLAAPTITSSTTPVRAAVKACEHALTGFRWSEDLANKVVIGPQADPGLIEQYRSLSAVLHHAQIQRRVRSVMIASAVAGEGKTLTATNLALTLSQSFKRRVLLIDADLRRPSVHEMFRLPNESGLTESLRHPDGGRLPVQTLSENLWVLTAGRPIADPMSGLVSDAMKHLLADAMEQFDWVVVDTPPVALMPDANLLARMIDAAVLIISANTTPYPLVQRAAAAIGSDRILGVLLNRADRPRFAHDYGYYGYQYRRPRTPEVAPRNTRFRLFGR